MQQRKNRLWVWGIFAMLLLSLLLPATAAQSQNSYEDLQTREEAEFKLVMSSSFLPSRDVEQVTARLSLFPQESDRTELLSHTTRPVARTDTSTDTKELVFFWNKNEVQGEQKLIVESTVRNKNIFPKVLQKVVYPLQNTDYGEFLQSTPSVTVNDPEIIALAEELTQGEDDALVVVGKIAGWVENNIEYSLDSVTAEASQSSRWVLQNRRGVCDELTNLFIALSRASGIPARFVSGAAFTNSPLFPDGWAVHGWAEVYLPPYGWIPVDVTYRQIGQVDLGHIPLKYAQDATDASIKYQWLGGTIDSKKLDVDATQISASGSKEIQSRLTTTVLREQAGFGSYNVVEATLENLEEYYLIETLTIATSDSLEISDVSAKVVTLAPREKKKLAWLVKVKTDLDPSLQYTSPLEIKSSQETVETTIISVAQDKVYAREDFESYLSAMSSSRTQSSSVLTLACTSMLLRARIGDTVTIRCEVHNLLAKKMVDLEVCIAGQCETTALDSQATIVIEKQVDVQHEGIQNIIVTTRNYEANAIAVVPLDVDRRPDIKLTIEAPAEMHYGEENVINFRVEKKEGRPQNSTLHIFINNREIKTTTLDDVAGLSLTIEGKLLSSGSNTIRYELAYDDGNDERYQKKGETTISLVDLSFWQKVKLFLRDLFS